jgi:hypothetical protein
MSVPVNSNDVTGFGDLADHGFVIRDALGRQEKRCVCFEVREYLED